MNVAPTDRNNRAIKSTADGEHLILRDASGTKSLRLLNMETGRSFIIRKAGNEFIMDFQPIKGNKVILLCDRKIIILRYFPQMSYSEHVHTSTINLMPGQSDEFFLTLAVCKDDKDLAVASYGAQNDLSRIILYTVGEMGLTFRAFVNFSEMKIAKVLAMNWLGMFNKMNVLVALSHSSPSRLIVIAFDGETARVVNLNQNHAGDQGMQEDKKKGDEVVVVGKEVPLMKPIQLIRFGNSLYSSDVSAKLTKIFVKV